MTIRIVTDSTSDLPHDLARELGITIIPLKVLFGTDEYRDGVDISTDEFFERLTAKGSVLPTTSQPSVGEFIEVYERLGQDADGIVSIHISAKVSGTYIAAIQATQQAKVSCPIEVIDSLQASMGLGMVAIAAAKPAKLGASLEEVVRVAQSAVGRCHILGLLDTLEYLEKGGRIGKARAFLGTLLKIKPLLTIHDGEAHELAKERTKARGLARLQQIARDYAPLEEMCVLYTTNPKDADLLLENLKDLLPEGKEPFLGRMGPVFGTYVGPGCVGIGLLRAES